jgi:hypothetical protein
MCIKVVSRVVYRWLMPQSRIRGSSRQMMHGRRSLSPAVLTRAQIPTSSMSAAATSARREDVAELGALDVPTIQYILHTGNPPVLDGGEDRGLAQASRLRSFRQREKYALSHRQPRSQRRRDVIPDPLARFGPGLSGAYTAQYPEPQILGHLDVGPDTNVQCGGRAPAAVLLEKVKTGLRACHGRRALAYLVEFRTAAGESLAISIPRTEAAVIRHFQERMPYGLFVPDVP